MDVGIGWHFTRQSARNVAEPPAPWRAVVFRAADKCGYLAWINRSQVVIFHNTYYPHQSQAEDACSFGESRTRRRRRVGAVVSRVWLALHVWRRITLR